MKPILKLLLPLASLSLGSAPADLLQPSSTISIAPYTARELVPGVHLLATPPDYLGGVIGNIIIVEQSDGMVVIDSGGTAADGRRAVAYIRSITRKPVTAMVYTHWHGDHPWGGSEIRAAWPGVRIISTAPTQAALRGPTLQYIGFRPDERFETIFLNQISGLLGPVAARARDAGQDDALRQRYVRMERELRARTGDFRGTHLVLPTETFANELLLDDPVRPVQLFHPGRANTDGDAVAWLPNQRILVSGDIVVSPTPFGFYSFPSDWIRVLERFKAMNFAILIPGHGEPQTDSVYLDRLIATLNDLRDQIGPLARQGLSLEDVRGRVNFSAQMAIFGDTNRNRALFEAYWLTPMTVNTYMEANGTPMVQGDESLYGE